MDLPQTLHGQLYLLSYDHKRRRFRQDKPSLLGFALRAAMLTDLYLTGYLEDRGGKPFRSQVVDPDDPLLREALERIAAGRKDWAELTAENPRRDSRAVRDQLQATGWLCVRPRRTLEILPPRLVPYDEDMVSGLSERVTEALRNAIDDLPADPRPLAVGFLGVLAQMPTVLSFTESSRHRQRLRVLTLATIEPILVLHQAIQLYYEDVRSQMGDGVPWTT